MNTHGIHHVTAIAGHAQRNLEFYAGTLGLRLVKKTVNFDDPNTYHLYYGDASGRPGTILTFFPWGDAGRGRRGAGQVNAITLSIPPTSLGYWLERLLSHNIRYDKPSTRFGASVISFNDPDGLPLELITDPESVHAAVWAESEVPAEHAVRGVHSVTLWERTLEPTATLLTETLGLEAVGQEDGRHRYRAQDGSITDVRVVGDFPRGLDGVGTVHHIAYRSADDAAQRALSEAVRSTGLHVTEQLDRNYFRSVYFREGGGVLLELATDEPGFTADEAVENLGSTLKLPPQYEHMRFQLEATLPELRLPQGGHGYEEHA